MARLLGEVVGGRVGYAVRHRREVSEATRIEVVTEGILTRRLQGDPALEGVSLLIFDEFHERSLQADLGLALALDARRHLREDLRILVMSATLDPGPLARLLGDAPVIRAEGASFPVAVEHRGDPPRGTRLPELVSRAVGEALAETGEDMLVFLPGAGEIRAAERLLSRHPLVAGGTVAVLPLFGDLPFRRQEEAILPGPRRRVVLATNVAETSLTIRGITLVVDAGWERRPVHDPATGLDRLVTVRASRSSAVQRAGRAGRTAPGRCLRLCSQHTFRGLPERRPPEILTADLAPLALELALWGARDPLSLPWLDPPPAAALESGRKLLRLLGALDADGGITPAGREMARYPLHPRLARLVTGAAEGGQGILAADLAAILSERDLFREGGEGVGGAGQEVTARLEALRRHRQGLRLPPGADESATASVGRIARQIADLLPRRGGGEGDPHRAGEILLPAFPDRLARRRVPGGSSYLLTSGRGVRLPPGSPLGSSEYLVALRVHAGRKAEGTIRLAAPLDEAAVRRILSPRIRAQRSVAWDDAAGRVTATRREHLGAVTLAARPAAATDAEARGVLLDLVRSRGPGILPFPGAARELRARVIFLAGVLPGEGWPDLSDGGLLARLEEWLGPALAGARSQRDLERADLGRALGSLLPPHLRRRLEELAPTHLAIPSGRSVRLAYGAEGPVLAVKLQEMFGCTRTPAVAGGRVPVLLHLLSPAGRPVQITRDLAGFWERGYREVAKELRGRYPRHPWPDDPLRALPTGRTARRG
jgi:ATP-dependent helicase HrpB